LVRHSNGCLFHLLTPETVTIELQETTVDSAWVSLAVSVEIRMGEGNKWMTSIK